MRGANDRTLMELGRLKSPAMLTRYVHLSPAHLWQAVEGLQTGTGTRTVAEELGESAEDAKVLNDMVSRLGFELTTLALKAQKVTIY